MGTIPPLREMIATLVAVGLALALVSYLLYARGIEAGLSRQRVFTTVVSIWGSVLIATAALLWLRFLLGGPLLDYSPGTHVSLAEFPPGTLASALVVGVIFVLCVVWAMRAVYGLSRLEEGNPRPPSAPNDQS